MMKKLLPDLILFGAIIVLIISLNAAEACHDNDDDEDEYYDCSIWSTDNSMKSLGVSNWPLLNGEAEVTAYKLSSNYCGCCPCCIDCCVRPYYA